MNLKIIKIKIEYHQKNKNQARITGFKCSISNKPLLHFLRFSCITLPVCGQRKHYRKHALKHKSSLKQSEVKLLKITLRNILFGTKTQLELT